MSSMGFTMNAWWMDMNIIIYPMIIMWGEKLLFALWYYIVCKYTNKVNLYHKVKMPIYVFLSTYTLHVQIKLANHIFVWTWEINRKLECLKSMYCFLFQIWGHIRNEILCRRWMGMLQKYWECLICELYVI